MFRWRGAISGSAGPCRCWVMNCRAVLWLARRLCLRLCSLIPGLGVKLSTIILAGPTVLSAVGACPPHDGVRRRWRINVASAVVLSDACKKSDDLTTATVPAGTTFPAVSREPCDLLMRATRQPFSSTIKLGSVDPHAVQNDRELPRDGDLGLAKAVSLGELGSPSLQPRPFRHARHRHQHFSTAKELDSHAVKARCWRAGRYWSRSSAISRTRSAACLRTSDLSSAAPSSMSSPCEPRG